MFNHENQLSYNTITSIGVKIYYLILPTLSSNLEFGILSRSLFVGASDASFRTTDEEGSSIKRITKLEATRRLNNIERNCINVEYTNMVAP